MTTDRDGNRSNPYKPNPEMCCEACTFRSGEHAEWCPVRAQARAALAALDLRYPLTVHMPTGGSYTLVKRLKALQG